MSLQLPVGGPQAQRATLVQRWVGSLAALAMGGAAAAHAATGAKSARTLESLAQQLHGAQGLRGQFGVLLGWSQSAALALAPRLVAAALLVLVGALALRLLTWGMRRSLRLARMDPVLAGLTVSAARAIVWIGLVTAALAVLGFNEIAVVTGGTVALVAMALASGASGTTTDILAGIFLAGDPHLTVGTRVRAGEVAGVLEGLTVRKAMIRDDQGNLHVVPNRTVDGATYVIEAAGPPQPAGQP